MSETTLVVLVAVSTVTVATACGLSLAAQVRSARRERAVIAAAFRDMEAAAAQLAEWSQVTADAAAVRTPSQVRPVGSDPRRAASAAARDLVDAWMTSVPVRDAAPSDRSRRFPGSYTDHFGIGLHRTLEHAAKVGKLPVDAVDPLKRWLDSTSAGLIDGSFTGASDRWEPGSRTR